MAGIILCLGNEAGQDVERIRYNFESCKGLQASYVFRDNKYQVVKYQRKYDLKDNNWFESPEVMVCAVGSILYKNYNFEDSVKEVGNSLSKGAKISEIVDEIDGTFCLLIINRKEHKCYIINDVGGVINTYFYKKNRMICFSTSMLALAKSFPVTPQLDSILMFIRSGMFFDETTYFKEINVLKPASIYEYDFHNSQLERKAYWSVPKEINESISFKDATASISRSLTHIIDTIPTEEALYDFTGGYDSRFVLSLAYSKEKDKNLINAFFFGPLDSREAEIVEKNCLNLGITYNNYPVPKDWTDKFFDYVLESNNLCDGLEDACAYAPVLMTQKLKRKHFRYSVHGTFGELFRPRTWEFEFGRRGRKSPANLKRMIKYRNLADDFDTSIFSEPYFAKINQAPNTLLSIYEKTNSIFDDGTPNTLQLDYIYFAQRARRWGGRTITTANQIIQPICPLWFRRPLEISFFLPPEYKKRCRLMRYIVENESPKFAKEKMITDTPFVLMNLRNIYLFVPGIVFFLRKAIRKFSQMVFNKTIWAGLTTPDYKTGEWYRRAIEDQRCEDLLNYDKMVSKNFYDKKIFNEFIQRAKTQKFHFYGQLGRIITVELTLRSSKLRKDVND